jgi:RNA polymerase primary sigma factor
MFENRDDQSLEQYLKEIGEFSPLKPEDEIRLAKKIRKGDQDALNRLTKANLRFVVSVAKDYQNRGLHISDLINEGNIGLIKAAKRFDETRGFKFISYAVWWIRQSILQALDEQPRVVRLPLSRVGALRKIGKATNQLEQSLERTPSIPEIASEVDMSQKEVNNNMKLSGRHLSLDAPFKAGQKTKFLDAFQDKGQSLPDRELVNESLRFEINRALSSLSEREALVTRLHYGLGNDRPMTLEEIGKRMQLTRERVRQIKEHALKRLRHRSRSMKLRKYLN